MWVLKGGPKVEGPKPSKREGTERWGADGCCSEGWRLEGWGPTGGKPPQFRDVLLLPPEVSLLFLSLGVFSWNFGVFSRSSLIMRKKKQLLPSARVLYQDLLTCYQLPSVSARARIHLPTTCGSQERTVKPFPPAPS